MQFIGRKIENAQTRKNHAYDVEQLCNFRKTKKLELEQEGKQYIFAEIQQKEQHLSPLKW